MPQGLQRVALSGEGAGFLLVGKDDVDVVLHQMAEVGEVRCHDVVACQVETEHCAGLHGCPADGFHQFVVLHQVALDVCQLGVLEELRRDVGGLQRGGCAETGAEGALSVGRDEGVRHAGRQAAPHQPGIDADVPETFGIEASQCIVACLAHKSHLVAQVRQCEYGVAGAASGGLFHGQTLHAGLQTGLLCRID